MFAASTGLETFHCANDTQHRANPHDARRQPAAHAARSWTLLLQEGERRAVTTRPLRRRYREPVADVVAKQVEVGIDVVSDGETSKISYATYIKDRLVGLRRRHAARAGLDLATYPGCAKRWRMLGDGEVSSARAASARSPLKDSAPLHDDIANFKRARSPRPRPVEAS